MRLRANELENQLQQDLAPIYLISGDEPLQLGEAADAVRTQARAKGFTGRDLLEVDTHFDWNRLAAEADSLSLFAERRIIDLRIPSGKPGTDGGKALTEYADRPPEETLLLITLPKLERSQTNSKWFKRLDKIGVVIQVWPLQASQLPRWIEQRMRNAELIPGPEVAAMLAERVEGNLLAARQEIEKLLLLNGPGDITVEKLINAVTDSARYDLFDLIDSALDGQIVRCIRILNGLRAEGTPSPVVLWALTRELRQLNGLSLEVAAGHSPQQAVAGRREIWSNRRSLVTKGLQRLPGDRWRDLLLLCGHTDRAIKGHDPMDPWLLLSDITLRMAGAPAVASTTE